MNGIRLAVIMMSAFFFLSTAISEVSAQRGSSRAGTDDDARREMEQAMRDSMDNDPGAQQGKSSTRDGVSRRMTRQSTRGDQSNAIKNNPLFRLFDENGDGQLSLQEIDAASRILYSLDANQDDKITAEEVADLATDGKAGSSEADDDDDEDDNRRMARNQSDRNSRSRSTARGRGTSRSGRNNAPSGLGAADLSMGANTLGNAGASSPNRSRGGSGRTAGLSGPSGLSLGRPGQPSDNKEFADYDRNEDGVLNRGELPSNLRTKFRRMDKNRNNEIDEDEYYDYMDNQ